MSVELRARVLAAAAAEGSPTRAAVTRGNRVSARSAGECGRSLRGVRDARARDSLARARRRRRAGATLERSVWLLATTASGAFGIAAAASWLALARGGSMLGRPRAWLLYALISIPIGLFAWKVGSSLFFGDTMIAWPSRPGLRCLSLSLAVAVGPLLSFLAIRRAPPLSRRSTAPSWGSPPAPVHGSSSISGARSPTCRIS